MKKLPHKRGDSSFVSSVWSKWMVLCYKCTCRLSEQSSTTNPGLIVKTPGVYLQHFFSFSLRSDFLASTEFVETPPSFCVLDMLKLDLKSFKKQNKNKNISEEHLSIWSEEEKTKREKCCMSWIISRAVASLNGSRIWFGFPGNTDGTVRGGEAEDEEQKTLLPHHLLNQKKKKKKRKK